MAASTTDMATCELLDFALVGHATVWQRKSTAVWIAELIDLTGRRYVQGSAA